MAYRAGLRASLPLMAALDRLPYAAAISCGIDRIVTCICLAISATYELIEWWTAVATGEAAQAFLGTQGDPWDTQEDMLMALIGALSAQVALARVQDREMERVASRL